MHARILLGGLVLSWAFLSASAAEAQPVGTFRWQLRPYCNVVTVAVTQNGGVYRLEGTDDQCGAGSGPGSVIGTAFPNPDGTIGLGLNIVAAPGGTPSPVHATLTLSTLGGTWRDSGGQTGAFVFTPGAGTGGSPRSSGGTIGAVAVDPSQVQLRVSGSCAVGLFMQSIGQGGTVGCAAAGAGGGGTITGVTPGLGLTGGGASGAVSLALRTAAAGTFDFTNPNGVIAPGTFGVGSIGASGAGTRLLWHPRKAAFRVGAVSGNQWDDASVGDYSFAAGQGTVAQGSGSVAVGVASSATGTASVALGSGVASGANSFAAGGSATGLFTAAMIGGTASGQYSFAAGVGTQALGEFSTALGFYSRASGPNSFAAGRLSTATGDGSVALGTNLQANNAGSVLLGSEAAVGPQSFGSFVFGDRSTLLDVISYGANEFVARAAGGVFLYTNPSLTSGQYMGIGGSQWLGVSDVNMKHAFSDLDGEAVLGKLARMSIMEWSYKSQDAAIRHVGPTAQEFSAAFNLGEDPLRIGTMDADGIALAAVKALEARTRNLLAASSDLARENATLKTHLARQGEQLRLLLARIDSLLDKR